MPVVSYSSKLVVLLLAWSHVPFASSAEPVRIWQAAPVRLDEVRGSQRRLLDRLERFISDKQWDEVLDIAIRILETESSSVVAVADEHYVSFHEHCQWLLSQLPQEQLASYRELVDPAAEVWYRRGVSERDEQLLQRVVDQSFCSRWGDDALWVLGELALERGETIQARRYWQSLSPQLVTLDGALTYPDTGFDLADVRARLLLVSLRDEDWPRAEAELAELQAAHPQARGPLGGREVLYAEHLALLVEQARLGFRSSGRANWSMFAGGAERQSATAAATLGYEQQFTLPLDPEVPTLPIVANGTLVYQSQSGLNAVELVTGAKLFSTADEILAPSAKQKMGQAFGTLTAVGSHVFGATDMPLGPLGGDLQGRAAGGLWGIDLERDGALILRQPSEEPSVAFAGAPLVGQSKLFAALRANDRTARAGIACYDLSRRRWIWQRWLCRSNTPATGWTQDVAATLLTADSRTCAGIVYQVTNLGAIAAVRAGDGRVLWIHTYDRMAAPLTAAGLCAYYRGPNPGICHRGRFLALPSDSRELLALDATTGALSWRRKLTSENAQLAAASDGKLLLIDGGLQVLDVRDGEELAHNSDLPLQGRALIAGEQIMWPSAGKIHFLNLETAVAQGPPLPLPESGFTYLAVAGDYLVAALPSQLVVYRARRSAPDITNVSKLP
jgi:outer membrane protein assembly factor BamB